MGQSASKAAPVQSDTQEQQVVAVAHRERTFIMVKPDALQRGLIHKVIVRLEARGFNLIAMKMCQPGRSQFEEHYEEHKGKPFMEGLLNRITSGPVVAMVWEGDDIISTTRKMIGATDPSEANPGTFRGDFGISKQRNGFHGSDSVESANREIALWFKSEEITNVESAFDSWVYEEAPKATPANSTVPKLDLKNVESSTPADESSRSTMRTAGLVGVAAVTTAAIAVGVIFAKR